MTNPTHRRKLARHLAAHSQVSYQQALEAVRRAAAAGALPARPAGGLDAHLPEAAEAAATWLRRDLCAGQFLQARVSVPGSATLLDADDLAGHVLILGRRGAERSAVAGSLVAGMLSMGWSGTVLDSASGLRHRCRSIATGGPSSFPYREANLAGDVDGAPTGRIDVCAGLGPRDVCEVLLSVARFSDAHWRQVAREIVGQVTGLLYAAHERHPDRFAPLSLASVLNLLRAESLPTATADARAALDVPAALEAPAGSPARAQGAHTSSAEDFSVLAEPSGDHLAVARSIVEELTWIVSLPAGQRVLVDESIVGGALGDQAPGLTYVGPAARGEGALAALVASSVVARTAGERPAASAGSPGGPGGAGGAGGRFLVIDDASEVDRGLLMGLLGRARAAGVCVLLACDAPSSWDARGRHDWAGVANSVGVVVTLGTWPADDQFRVDELLRRRGTGDVDDEPVRDAAPGSHVQVRPVRRGRNLPSACRPAR